MHEYEQIVRDIGGLSVVEYRPSTGEILLDANLTLRELKAITWWVENRPADPIPASLNGVSQ